MNSIFKDTFDYINNNIQRVKEGKVNCIPFSNFPRLGNKIPGIIQGTNWIVTASSGIGKSQFTKSMFVLEPYQWVTENPNKGVKIKILYFALEESKREFTLSMISHKLKTEYNIMIDPLELSAMYGLGSLPKDIKEKISSFSDYFEEFYKHVEIIDTISNPTGIYKYIRNYSRENGTHYYYNFYKDKKKDNPITLEDYNELTDAQKKSYAYSHYIPNDPDEYVICIVDHISLLKPEKGAETLHAAMGKMSADFGRMQITKHFNYTMVLVQQQAGETEKNVYDKMGNKIVDKLKPSLAGLADNKLTQRDAHVVIGLFAPNRYAIKDYEGYNIEKLDDQYRSGLVLKNRIGRGNLEVPMYFNGAITKFKELPLPKNMTEEFYSKVEEIQNQMR